MNAKGGVELSLRGAALERHSKPLNDLRRVGARHVASHDQTGLPLDDELHEHLLPTLRYGVLKRSEGRTVDIQPISPELLPCLQYS